MMYDRVKYKNQFNKDQKLNCFANIFGTYATSQSKITIFIERVNKRIRDSEPWVQKTVFLWDPALKFMLCPNFIKT